MEYLSPVSFLIERQDIPVVDVRSPAEYEKGHIAGAINIPIFSDVERAEIGTIYKNKGRIAAIRKGLELVGPKISNMADGARAIAQNDHLKVYCWRGGMRSEKMSWLFELVGISCFVLKGGFKAFRNQLLKDLSDLPKLVVLQGPTGSGKTDVLYALSKKGEQVVDLERLACHRGSAFGHIGMEDQPSSLQFQNNVYAEILKLDRTKKIWVESESLSIGKVYLPETLWESINRAPVIELSIPKYTRIKRLVQEYGQYDRELLVSSTIKIAKKFGHNNVREVLNYIRDGDLEKAAGLLLDYYDKSYKFSQNKYKPIKPFIVESRSGDPKINADKVMKKAEKISF
jgi:tRNA 2-selenouridine synthase